MGAPVQGFLFDVDGTLVLGDRHGSGYRVLPGADKVLDHLLTRQIPYALLTNGSAYAPATVAAKLRAVGLPVTDRQLLTPPAVAAATLKGWGAKRVLILSAADGCQPLADLGIELVQPGDPGDDAVDAVFVGWHPHCTMRDIEAAARAVWAGARLCTASDVPFFATREGRSIGYSRAITAAVRSLTGKRPSVLGKPSQHALRHAARLLGVPMDAIAVVGDDPHLEMAMARKGGALGIAVTTGLTGVADWHAQPPARRPHRVLAVVGDLMSEHDLPTGGEQ
jgi:4-nitrophenyl phosphatase